MLPSVALLSLLSLVCHLHHISPASGGLFDNPESYTNASTYCVVCYGDSHPSKSKSSDVKLCSELRMIIRSLRKFIADKTKNKNGKTKKKEEELTMTRVFKDFGKKCPSGETDCFTTYSTDKRIIGFESMGCGGGPPEVPAEPNEPCQTGYIRFGGKNQEMETCVCENKPLSRQKDGTLSKKNKEKEKKMPHAYCNYEYLLKQGGSISVGSPMLLTMMAAFGTILRTVLILT